MPTTPMVPFGPAPVSEIPLPDAPLETVVAQVRFQPILLIEQSTHVAPFQEALRHRYPGLRKENEVSLKISSKGVEQSEGTATVWRFDDTQGEWEVALGANFLSLVTRKYTSRKDFVSRFIEALTALSVHIAPGPVERLGVRYVDRISGEQLRSLPRLVRPELLGILWADLGEGECEQSISASSFVLDDGSAMTARWGLLKAHSTFDTFIAPVPSPSWILDIDIYSTGTMAFDPIAIAAKAELFARRVYDFFRWAVQPEFLEAYGGDVK